MNKVKYYLLPSLGLLLLVTFYLFERREPTPIEELNLVEVERPIEAVAALGQLSPMGEIRTLAAPISGFGGTPRVSKLFIAEGDEVIKGQVIAEFDNRPHILADLAVNKTRLQTVRKKMQFQKIEVLRYTKTSNEGATSLLLLEQKKDALESLESKANEIIAETKVLKVDLSDTELKSPIDGIVLSINSREGERPGIDGVVNVGANKSMGAVIEVYESDIDRVKIGQSVSLTSENGGFKGELSGIVSKISPQVQQRKVLSTDPTGDADARIVEVRVDLEPKSSSKVTSLTGMKVIARFLPL